MGLRDDSLWEKALKIGIDLDGVLCNFTDAYAEMLSKEVGINFPKNGPDWPTTWYWDRAAMAEAGIPKTVAKQAETKVWDAIKNSAFWAKLLPLPNALETLDLVHEMRIAGHEIYFITTRPGKFAKFLTENWLRMHGLQTPTVIIATNEASKGLTAKALGLDVFIDDKPENCDAVREATKIDVFGPEFDILHPCRVFLVDAPYNHDAHFERVTSALEALKLVLQGEKQNLVAAAA